MTEARPGYCIKSNCPFFNGRCRLKEYRMQNLDPADNKSVVIMPENFAPLAQQKSECASLILNTNPHDKNI